MSRLPWLRHFLKFNAVGAIGIVAQLAALAVFKGLFGMQYLVATALAVETAVLHNFVWHERWTWADRTRSAWSARAALGRLARFNLSAGGVSMASNLLFMRLFVGQLHVPYLAANLLSIALTSLANFLLSDLFVFRG